MTRSSLISASGLKSASWVTTGTLCASAVAAI